MKPNRALLPLLLALPVFGAVACTEDPLTGLDAKDAPGAATPTVEIEIPVDQLPFWRDTTYVGYSVPSSSSFREVADSSELLSRVLGRVQTIPDSVTVGDSTYVLSTFQNGRFRILIDTLSSVVPSAGMELSVVALDRGFVAQEATWTLASVGEPWTTPGGDLGTQIGGVRLEALEDTVFVPFDLPTDSVLTDWRSNDGANGFAVVATGSGSTLNLRGVAVLADGGVVDRDTSIAFIRSASPTTVIFSPETPPPGSNLRLAGLPASRIYLTFQLPESVGDLALRGSNINRAVLVLRPEAPEPAPFLLVNPLSVSSFRLLADPFIYGPKTPIGTVLGGLIVLDPDSLAAGNELTVPLTPLVQVWAGANPDSIQELSVGVQALPEGLGLGFWNFGSAEGPVALRPSIRLMVTPRVPFILP